MAAKYQSKINCIPVLRLKLLQFLVLLLHLVPDGMHNDCVSFAVRRVLSLVIEAEKSFILSGDVLFSVLPHEKSKNEIKKVVVLK